MPKSIDRTVAQQLKEVPPSVRPIVQAARRAVQTVAPRAEEVAYQSGPPRSPSMMWKLARYQVDGENVVGIGTFTNHSALFFYRGRELDDPMGLLQGSGKDSRFIRLEAPADLQSSAISRLLREAFRLSKSSPSSAKRSR